MAAAMAGGKSKKKKWSKGKSRDLNQNKVQFEEELYTRFMAEVPKMKLITPSALVERLKVNASLARAAIKELEAADKIKRVSYHHSQWIYTRATKVSLTGFARVSGSSLAPLPCSSPPLRAHRAGLHVPVRCVLALQEE